MIGHLVTIREWSLGGKVKVPTERVRERDGDQRDSGALGQLLARSAEHRKRLISERHAAARDLLAATAHAFEAS